MNIAVVYCYPMVKSRTYFPLAQRFAESWKRMPPAIPHHLYVIANGGTPQPTDKYPFDGIDCTWKEYDNTGWDIGSFQWAAEKIPCDLLVCLGAPVHFHKPGWLELMAEAYIQNDIALYGCWAYPHPTLHVRTTAFWMPPALLQSYPKLVGSSRASRYEFEHGGESFTRHVLGIGLECLMVTRRGIFSNASWPDNAPGVEESLVLDQHIHK